MQHPRTMCVAAVASSRGLMLALLSATVQVGLQAARVTRVSSSIVG